MAEIMPHLHGDSDPVPDPDWVRLHGGKLDSNLVSDHLSHVDCDPNSNPGSGPCGHVNIPVRSVSHLSLSGLACMYACYIIMIVLSLHQ